MSLLQQLDSSPKVRMRQPECLSPRQQVKTLGMASCGLTALAILMGGGGAEIGVRLTTNIIVGIAVMHKLLVHYYNEQHPSSMLPLVFIQFIKVNVIYTHDASICPEPAESPPGYTSKGRGF